MRSAQALTSFLPRDAGEDEGGGLNGLNDWNVLNGYLLARIFFAAARIDSMIFL
jgi:hypothetical protein